MIGYHIHIQGRVQGVGFRPFIYRLATEKKLNGWIKNSLDGVHIQLNADPAFDIVSFIDIIKQDQPEQASIEGIKWTKNEFPELTNSFNIILDEEKGPLDMPLTPDFAICDTCRKELADPENRRSLYPFITCTNCGPRYSIITKMPYDRPNTTMDKFELCDQCAAEYSNPLDRRFYSQTNSCHNCPVSLTLFNPDGEKVNIPEESILPFVAGQIKADKIVAIKGIGGYLLFADACSTFAVEQLRRRKNRPFKPFALMYPDHESAEGDVIINDEIKKAWRSPESPIILCDLKKEIQSRVNLDQVAPGLNRLGIMMPYTPLFVLLMDLLKKPVVATSGNISGSPIIYKDDKALLHLRDFADYILTNNREIVVPQDDSMIQFTGNKEKRIILRRSRGLAPEFTLKNHSYQLNQPTFASGAMLKSAFGLYHRDRYYLSQYLGDTGDLETQESYESVVEHMFRILDFKPGIVITDLHPDYPSTHFGKKLADELHVPTFKIQHHKAHTFSVLGENELIDEDGILCVIWDGTGLGDDRQVWGGEFFHYDDHVLSRAGHLDYFPNIAGDKMAEEPRISALSILSDHSMQKHWLKNKFTDIEWKTYTQLAKSNSLGNSSMGRVFDAVASLLGLCDKNHYEGEAAMKLQVHAEIFYERDKNYDQYYPMEITKNGVINIRDLMHQLLDDFKQGRGRSEIVFKFHNSLVHLILDFARNREYKKIAFSGGVFQNSLLVDLILKRVESDFRLYFHKNLSPNDEGIPFGQMMAYYASLKNQKLKENHILSEHLN